MRGKQQPEDDPVARAWMWRTLALLGALTVFRLVYITYPDVLPDEAYYWLWSKHLDASYYSKGPAIAYTIAFGTAVFGDGPFGLRWMAVMLAAGTGWQLFVLTRRLYDSRTAFWAVMTASAVPLFAVGSVLMTIDPLSVFFWTWSANLFLDALKGGRWWQWALVGFGIGSGFLAKFINAMELVAFLLYLAWVPQARGPSMWRGVLWMVGVFAVCTLPVIVWNASHGWPTGAELAKHAAAVGAVPWREFASFVQMQALVISPVLFVLILVALAAVGARRLKSPSEKFLLTLWAPVFLFYAALAWKEAGEANWPVTSYVGAIPLAAAFWLEQARRQAGWLALASAALVLGGIQTAALHETSWLGLPAKLDPMRRARGWKSFGREIDAMRKYHHAQVLIGDRYQTAALISYYCEGRPAAYIVKSPRIDNQFSFWPSYTLRHLEPVLYVTESIDAFPRELIPGIAGAGPVHQFWTTDASGERLRQYQVWLCMPKENP
jgi:hypothetical protein